MKLITLPLVAALSGLAAAATGHVYTYDPSTSSSSSAAERRILSPVTARLVLAQRAGAEEYHVERMLSEEEIEVINDFGSKTPLFGQDERIRKAFFLSVGEIESDVLSRVSPSFAISPVPAAPATQDLFHDLAKQLDPTLERLTEDEDQAMTTASGDIFYTATSLSDLEAKFLQLREEGTWALTALLVPSAAYARIGSGSYQWGTYSMPSSQSSLNKRSKRQIGSEEPLTALTTHSTVPVSSSSHNMDAFAKNQSTPLAGILPSCFRSQSECETSTRNCTGHGSCSLKYTNKDSPSGAKGECFSCSCSATVQKLDGGKKKTTVWGGPACQKKDVSVQFWLIALFTVGLVFLVSFAVGTVYSMGGEELPSVIGAGVSGPVRK